MGPCLVIVTSKKCGACERFKANVLPELIKKLKRVDCQVRHVDINSFSSEEVSDALPEYPPTVKNYVGWYPTLLFFPEGSGSEEPRILNGKMAGGKPQFTRYEVDYDPEGITGWVEKHLSPSRPVSRYELYKDGKYVFGVDVPDRVGR